MKRIVLLISGLLFSLCISTYAQDGVTLHFMRLNPYSTYLNPSSYVQYKGYFGVPAVSCVNAAITNTGLHYDNIFITNSSTGKVTGINGNKAISKLADENNQLNINLAVDILNFGFMISDWNINFSYRIRYDQYSFYNKDLVAFPVLGNLSFAGYGNEAEINTTLVINSYQEFGIGIRKDIDSHWTIGFKPKLLLGIENFHTNNFTCTIYTNPENYAMKIMTDIDAQMGGLAPIVIKEDGKVTIKPRNIAKNWRDIFRNVGAAIDLGVTYRFNDNVGIAASVLDLGFITWKTTRYDLTCTFDSTITQSDGSLQFSGFKIDDVLNGKKKTSDILKDAKNLVHANFIPSNEQYTQALNGRFTVEGFYNLGKYHRFSALFQGRIVKNHFIPSFSVAWNGNFLNVFDLCVSYTIAPKSYTNLGVGLGFNLGVFHIYAVTDNILAICNSKSIQRSLLNTTSASAQVGIVFDWGKIPQKSAGAMKVKAKKQKNENDNQNDNQNENQNKNEN